jgi:hypothetical protein
MLSQIRGAPLQSLYLAGVSFEELCGNSFQIFTVSVDAMAAAEIKRGATRSTHLWRAGTRSRNGAQAWPRDQGGHDDSNLVAYDVGKIGIETLLKPE